MFPGNNFASLCNDAGGHDGDALGGICPAAIIVEISCKSFKWSRLDISWEYRADGGPIFEDIQPRSQCYIVVVRFVYIGIVDRIRGLGGT